MDMPVDALDALQTAAPLRVVHLLHTVAYGGVETIVLDWAGSLRMAGAEVMVVCFANPDQSERPFLEAARRVGVPVRTIVWGRRKPVFAAARELEQLLRSARANIVHTHNVYAEIVGWMAARRVGAKLVSSLYVWSDFGWKRNVQQRISAALLKRFDLVTSQCETTLRDTTRRGVPRAIQQVLAAGITVSSDRLDAPTRHAIRARMTAGPGDVVLANVARLYPEKAQDRLLAWFATIHRLRPCVKLWILGVGPLETELRQQAVTLGIADQVSFLGFVPDMQPVLMAADIQVHSSRAEGVPLAICAGMAAGMPIVATAVGGIPEVIAHGRTGLLVSETGEAFVDNVLHLVDDAPLRHRLGAQARQAAATELSLAAASGKLIGMYRVLVP